MGHPSSSSKEMKKTKKKVVETCRSFNRGHLPSKADLQRYQTLSAPHVESFNYFLDHGLSAAISDIEPIEFDVRDPKDEINYESFDQIDVMKMWVENVKISRPMLEEGNKNRKLTPRMCRELGVVYSGQMTGEFCYQVIHRQRQQLSPDDNSKWTWTETPGKLHRFTKKFGDMPIMILSEACHLRGKSPAELAHMREEQNEFGGYFIVNGIERCVRLLQIPRRNHPTAIKRSNYKNRGPTYSDLGVAIRCARENHDQSSITNTLHYLTTGGASFKFSARKQEFLIPVILVLRALSAGNDEKGGGVTDKELYDRIIQGDEDNTFLKARAQLLLQEAQQLTGLHTPKQCLAFLGSRFRLMSMKSASTSDVDIGHYIIKRYVLIHVVDYGDKLECLLLCLRKLYAFAAGDCGVDNADSLQNQEILLPGHLITTFVKEKFEEMLMGIRMACLKEMRQDFPKASANLQISQWWLKSVDRFGMLNNGGLGKKVQHFLSTGNIISSSGLDLMQVSGYTIVAERLNFLRYCAHFRSVHRGQFFMQMKTTAVRKLLPDQWGFLCPVHTPDGGPCGLLSHLALKCEIMAAPDSTNHNNLESILISLGVTPSGAGGTSGDGRIISTHNNLSVCIDGRVIGGAPAKRCKLIASALRIMKVEENPKIPPTLEVAYIPPGISAGPYPGLFLATGAARLIRPVLNVASGKIEQIGPMEQPFLDIACLSEDIREGITTHRELDPTNMLSLIASLTPFSDYNQSPRNMYQCQMGKQTMGTPCHSFPHRSDNKLYRIQNPQAPIAQTARFGEYKMDEYPNGANAVVAVLSYTGFDMEDAMILNKSAYERGFGHASVYKTIEIDLQEERDKASSTTKDDTSRMRFSNKKVRGGFTQVNSIGQEDNNGYVYPSLSEDGLPPVGSWVKEGDPIYCIVDSQTGKDRIGKHKEKEDACVQNVRLLGTNNKDVMKVSMTLRIPRNPVIGDKFSSRHGQKGVLSILWNQVDMPFSESGMSPDVIINPHAFPSRMTIGMLIESMAGKSGALHGIYQDATPFSFHESGDKVAVDYFGEQLQAAGYSYYGSEPLYSGVSGCLMHADLYIGVVYYQRLRHMVSDKYQVRATGQVNPLTRQPVKGRKKGGGIRLGEMERDSLLSHGAAFILQDRLLNCSDKHVAYACRRCGDLLSPTTERSTVLGAGQNAATGKARLRVYCRNPKCRDAPSRPGANDEMVEPIILPYVFRYLANELSAMNIKMILDIK
jgi:DNA-directed RNA polymerase I subunit RPA2